MDHITGNSRARQTLRLAVCATGLMLMVAANAATYHVAVDGSDAGDGSINQPWQTIDTAVDRLGAGDTLYLRGGTYVDLHNFDTEDRAAGTPSAPITISAYPGETVVLDYDSTSGNPLWLKGAYVVLAGVEVTGSHGYGVTIVGEHITVSGCTFHDNYDDSIKILAGSDYITVTQCTFYDCNHNAIDTFGAHCDVHHNLFASGGSGIVMKGGSHDNTLHHNVFDSCNPLGGSADWGDSAISVGGWSKLSYKTGEYECENTLVYNNIIYNTSASGLYFWEARNCAAYNNTFYNNQGQYGIAIFGNDDDGTGERHQSVGITLRNNVLVDSGSRGTVYVAGGNEVGFVSESNLYWHSTEGERFAYDGGMTTWRTSTDLAGFQTHFGMDQLSQYAEPIFANIAANDLHLLAASPGVDQGTYATGVPLDDLDSSPRPLGQAYDVGAYETAGPDGGNAPPQLAWTGEAGYVTDGLEPELAPSSTEFVWKVRYSDEDGDQPHAVYLHVYGNAEELAASPYTMTADGTGDWADGVVFSKGLQLARDVPYTYAFSARDEHGAYAAYPATSVAGPAVSNSAPSLEWPDEEGFDDNGLAPDEGYSATEFCWRIVCRDVDGDAAQTVRLHVLSDGVDVDGSPYTMTSDGGSDWQTGVTFTTALQLPRGDAYSYFFTASDDYGDEVTYPEEALAGPQVRNSPPALTWTGEAGYESDGFAPETGTAETEFQWQIRYADTDNDASQGVLLHLFRDGEELEDSPCQMTAQGSDGWVDGVTFTTTLTLTKGATYTYSFSTSDADGAPASFPEAPADGAVVNNTAPTAPTVTVSPQQPLDLDDLTASATGSSDVDASDEVSYIYRWYRDGTLQEDITGPTASAGRTAGGQTWRCVVAATDGEDEGESAYADVVITPTYTIAGTVVDSHAEPLADVRVTVGQDTLTTGGDGTYSTSGLLAGEYSVSVELAEYAFSPSERTVSVGPTDAEDVDFSGTRETYTASGTVLDDAGVAVAGVIVSCGEETTTTAADGSYSFAALFAGEYDISAALAEYSIAPASHAVTVNESTGDCESVDFTGTQKTYTISGTVVGPDGSALADVSVTADEHSGVTDADGAYTLTGLVAGEYSVFASLAEHGFDPPSRSVAVSESAGDQVGIDFTASLSSYAVSGHVRTASGDALVGVLVAAGGREAHTDAQGQYTIEGLIAGTHVISAELLDYHFTPAGLEVTLSEASGDATQIDLTGALVPREIEIVEGPSGSPSTTAPGATVQCAVDARSTRSTDSLCYNWSALNDAGKTMGSFDDASSASPTWTAPLNCTDDTWSLTVSVEIVCAEDTDVHTAASYVQQVSPIAHEIHIVDDASGNPDSVDSGHTVQCSVTVDDTRDGHELVYVWTAKDSEGVEAGDFDDATSAHPTWTAPLNLSAPIAEYEISVRVSCSSDVDVYAASSYSQRVMRLAHTFSITDGPTADLDNVVSGGPVHLSVSVADTHPHDFGFEWTARDPQGTEVGGFDDPTAQDPTWTAPANATGELIEYEIAVTAQCSGDVTDAGSCTVGVYAVCSCDFTSGTRMVGVPMQPASPDAAIGTTSAVDFAWWDPLDGRYRALSQPLTWTPGRGYWMHCAEQLALAVDGVRVTAPVSFAVHEGWNMISPPYDFEIDVAALTAQGNLRPFAWTDQGEGYYLVAPAVDSLAAIEGTLRPWQGYWVLATEDGNVYWDPAGAAAIGHASVDTLQIGAADADLGGWQIQLCAASGDRVDSCNFLGMASVETVEALQLPNPPFVDNSVDLYFPTTTGAMASDISSVHEARSRWDFEVRCDTDAPVCLTFPDLSSVPSDCALMLHDDEADVTVNMRTTPSYRYQGGGTRSFHIEITVRSPGTLAIGAVSTHQVSAGTLSVEYVLNTDADVDLEVRNISGRPIRRLSCGTVSAGINSEQWDLRNAHGAPVPSGTYLCVLVARTADGTQARRVVSAGVRR